MFSFFRLFMCRICFIDTFVGQRIDLLFIWILNVSKLSFSSGLFSSTITILGVLFTELFLPKLTPFQLNHFLNAPKELRERDKNDECVRFYFPIDLKKKTFDKIKIKKNFSAGFKRGLWSLSHSTWKLCY